MESSAPGKQEASRVVEMLFGKHVNVPEIKEPGPATREEPAPTPSIGAGGVKVRDTGDDTEIVTGWLKHGPPALKHTLKSQCVFCGAMFEFAGIEMVAVPAESVPL